MKKILDIITEEVMSAFVESGYDKRYAKVTLSNRPDLCEYQCNGALAAAKEYKKAPIQIAQVVVEKLADSTIFSDIQVVNPGFINIKIAEEFLTHYLNDMKEDSRLGCEKAKTPKTIIIDYGGPNVAKPLHVGHLRSAIIGESIKRMARFAGHNVIGDVHLGDWGLQIGLIIAEVKRKQPTLCYFDEAFSREYPKEAPFTIAELEKIYPAASARSKEDEAFREEATQITYELQNGHAGYNALWNHILEISISDLKKNYEKLLVSFDLWKKESDAQQYVPEMVEKMKRDGYAYISEGALVVDVKEETDTKEIPPCMILKSNGASLYQTTDLATIVEREKLFQPDEMIYVVDKRQELHFEQVFRCARKTKIVNEKTKLRFLGFGTMNGKDGKPFKTREGGTMRLENLISEINDEMYRKIIENKSTVLTEDAKNTARIVGLSAIKYGDLSNQASKDYVFDVERFTSFEGDTGPYLLYTIVRIKSILAKYQETVGEIKHTPVKKADSESEKNLMLACTKFNSVIENSLEEIAPHKLCAYIYDLANVFNRFYHEMKIIAEEDKDKQAGYIQLLLLTKEILETSIELLGFEAPERM